MSNPVSSASVGLYPERTRYPILGCPATSRVPVAAVEEDEIGPVSVGVTGGYPADVVDGLLEGDFRRGAVRGDIRIVRISRVWGTIGQQPHVFGVEAVDVAKEHVKLPRRSAGIL